MLERQLGGALARQAGLNDHGIGPLLLHRGKSPIELLAAADPDAVDRSSAGFAGKLDLFEERFGEGIGRIGQSGHAACRRQHFPNEFDAFAGQFGGHASDPGDISARPRKARDKTHADWISRVRHDDWDFARRLLCRLSGGREPSDDYIDFETDQLGGQFGKPVDLSFRRSKLKSNVLPFDVSQISQPLPEYSPKLFRIGIANNQRADRRHLRLLRPRHARPDRHAAESGYQFPPSDGDWHKCPPLCEGCRVNGTIPPGEHAVVTQEGPREAAAPRDFDPAYVSSGSSRPN